MNYINQFNKQLFKMFNVTFKKKNISKIYSLYLISFTNNIINYKLFELFK